VRLSEFFQGQEESEKLYTVVKDAVDEIGPSQIETTLSQVVFSRRGTSFAFVWVPEVYQGRTDLPLVLTIVLPVRYESRRCRQVVELENNRFAHHVGLRRALDVDDEVRCWLKEAWEAAG
jgi:hypothetical protein